MPIENRQQSDSSDIIDWNVPIGLPELFSQEYTAQNQPTVNSTMARYDPPPKFTFKAAEWEEWLSEYEEFMITAKVNKEEGATQVSSLLYTMGARQSKPIFKTFKFGTIKVDGNDVVEKKDDYETVARKFTEHFVPKRNIIHERSIFQERSQLAKMENGKKEATETVEEFVRDLQSLVLTCKYIDADDQVRDRFVIGLTDTQIKGKLQLTSDLTLEKAITMARQHEQVKSQLKQQAADGPVVQEIRTWGRGRS
jgi:hypothetical protein